MDISTHIGFNDQISAIDLLPPPPGTQLSEGNATSIQKANGSKSGSKCPITDLGQLGTIWIYLPDDVKANILDLVNMAVK